TRVASRDHFAADEAGRATRSWTEDGRAARKGDGGTARHPRAPAAASGARPRPRRRHGRRRGVRTADSGGCPRGAALAERSSLVTTALARGGPGRTRADGR